MVDVFEHEGLGLAIGEEAIIFLEFFGVDGPFIFDDVEVDLLNQQVMLLHIGQLTKERFR